jgi:4-amino-4-deoxy-L-arabinose transferase-like glycosyltransferase
MPPSLVFLQTALEAALDVPPAPAAGPETRADPKTPFLLPLSALKRWFVPLALAALTATGGVLRFHQIDRNGFWLDEAFSVWMAAHPLPELFDWLVAIDQHPPLYYTLLHTWLWGGDEGAYVRALSALLSTLAIPILFLIGRRLGGAGVGLVAAAIFTFSPFHVRFAQEARMYALLTLCVSLAVLALVHLLTEEIPEGRNPRLAWLGYIVFTAATLLTHNTAVFFPLAANLFVLGFWLSRRGGSAQLHELRPPPLRKWLWAQGGVLLLWLPWSYAFVVQSAGVYNEFWIPAPTGETVLNAAKTLLNDFLPRTLARGIPADPWVWLGLATLLLLGMVALRKRSAALALLLCLLLIPWVGELLVSLRRPIFYDRTLIWTTIPLYLLLAFGILQLRFKLLVAAALLLLLSVNLLSLQNYYRTFEKEQWREAAAYMAGAVQEGDLILFNATWVQIPFDYYFQRFYQPRTQPRKSSGEQPGLPPVVQHGVPVDLFDAGVLEPKMTPADLPRLQELLKGRERVWLVYSHDWYTDPQRLIPAALKRELHYLGAHPFNGLQILEFERR